MSTELLHIPLNSIVVSKLKLRDVDRDKEDYLALVDSIRRDGVMSSISVQASSDPESGEKVYILVDGLQRFTASQDAGKDTIPAQVYGDITEDKILFKQIIANAHRIEMKPVQYSKALDEILKNNPTMTMHELATSLSKSSAWLTQRLKLNNLVEKIGEMVDNDDISLSNAQNLAKLPPEEQVSFADRAIAMPPDTFSGLIAARKKELDKARREGRDASAEGFTPISVLRKKSEIEEERNSGAVASVLCKGITSVEEAFALAVSWVLNLDADSVAKQEEDYNMRQEERKRKKAEAEVERAKKKAKDAAEKAVELEEKAKEVVTA